MGRMLPFRPPSRRSKGLQKLVVSYSPVSMRSMLDIAEVAGRSFDARVCECVLDGLHVLLTYQSRLIAELPKVLKRRAAARHLDRKTSSASIFARDFEKSSYKNLWSSESSP